MAIQISFTTIQGFTAPAAYVRIGRFSGTKEVISVNLEYFYDVAAKNNNAKLICMDSYQLPLPLGATYTQMYEALKALPQFAGAVDC